MESADKRDVESLKLKHRHRIKRLSIRGQATVEVILAAVISVIVILGLVYRFNQAFRQYTIDLYGNYYRCLLEAGELPGSGGMCSNQQAAYAVANGKFLVNEKPLSGSSQVSNAGSSGASSGSDSSGSSNGTSGSNPTNGSNGSPGGTAGASATGGGQSPGTEENVVGASGDSGPVPVGRVAQSRARSDRVSQSGTVGDGDSEKESQGELKKSDLGAANRDFSGASGRQARTKMDYFVEDAGSNSAGSIPLSALSASSQKVKEGDDPLRPRRAEEKLNRSPAAKNKDVAEGSFDFGNIIRIFLIVLLIAAVVFFFAGQMLQISKSAEK